jgi:hypothetical protein
MRPKRNFSVVVAICVLMLTLGSGAASAEEVEAYPVWWSPSLGLKSLDWVNSLLVREFPRQRQFHVIKYEREVTKTDTLLDENAPELGYRYTSRRVNVEEHWIANCQDLIKWTDEGFDTDFDHPYWHFALGANTYYSGRCYALSALKTAKPARTSYLRDFVFDNKAMTYLPAMIGMGWDCRGLNEFLEANRWSVPWSEFIYDYYDRDLPNYNIFLRSGDHVIFQRMLDEARGWIDYETHIVIYGRGDFNGDGLDDMLVRRTRVLVEQDFERTQPGKDPASSILFLVTRREGDEVLRVVDLLGPPPMSGRRCRPRTQEFELE